MADLLIADIGGRLVGLPRESVRAIGRIQALTKIPATGALPLAVAIFNNRLEAAVDLNAIWKGGELEPDAWQAGIALEAGGWRGVLLAREVGAFASRDELTGTAETESDPKFDFITGSFQWGGKSGFIIDTEGLLRFIRTHPTK